MSNVIVWKSKHEEIYYDASNESAELSSFLKIFQEMKEQGDYETCPPEGKQQIGFYEKALAGDKVAAKKFLLMRCDYEYENVSVERLITA